MSERCACGSTDVSQEIVESFTDDDKHWEYYCHACGLEWTRPYED